MLFIVLLIIGIVFVSTVYFIATQNTVTPATNSTSINIQDSNTGEALNAEISQDDNTLLVTITDTRLNKPEELEYVTTFNHNVFLGEGYAEIKQNGETWYNVQFTSERDGSRIRFTLTLPEGASTVDEITVTFVYELQEEDIINVITSVPSDEAIIDSGMYSRSFSSSTYFNTSYYPVNLTNNINGLDNGILLDIPELYNL